MTPQATEFDLPQDIIDQINDPSSGVRTVVTYISSPPPPGYEVRVYDAFNNLIYYCPHPCRMKSEEGDAEE